MAHGGIKMNQFDKKIDDIVMNICTQSVEQVSNKGGENMDERTEQAIQNVVAMRETLKKQQFSQKMVKLIVLTTLLEKLVDNVKDQTKMGITTKKE